MGWASNYPFQGCANHHFSGGYDCCFEHEIIGKYSKSDEIAIALSKDFDIDFSPEALKQLEEIPNYVSEKDKEDLEKYNKGEKWQK